MKNFYRPDWRGAASWFHVDSLGSPPNRAESFRHSPSFVLLYSLCCLAQIARGGRLHPARLLCALVFVLGATELRAETTIYVGKHFEVRKHDAAVKYVFNGGTRVARVTGSLLGNELPRRYFRIRTT